ncbi:MAG: DUF6733 family protein [Myxococcota bacterium]
MTHSSTRILQPGLLAVLIASSSSVAAAQTPSEQASSEGPSTSISVVLKQDIFFGFHGIGQVSAGLTDSLDITFYAILWTRDAFGAGASGGNLWTEFGGGLNLSLLDGNLSINPQVGLLNGTLLSGNAERGLTIEGFVPNITLTYGDGFLEGQIYAGMYLALRELNGSPNNEYLHYWANLGIGLTSWLSVGAHWEHLWQTRGSGPDPTDVYQWLGPYVEAKSGAGFIRFAGGIDLVPDDTSDFYQVSIGLSI